MYFFQPLWLRHGQDGAKRNAVLSLDLEPNGKRLASAGQDSRVKIWSCDVLQTSQHLTVAEKVDFKGDKEVEVETSKDGFNNANKAPKGALLATLMYHAGAVNCIRWSPSGTMLASGGDDSVVLTYERLAGSGGRASSFGGGEGSIENWRCRKALRGHVSDVMDVSWAPDSDRLCSGSIDNVIFIWSTRSERALMKLEGHKGYVKGVAWDPIGKYIASQSTDRSVIIWRTVDWKIEKKITAPFAEATLHQNNFSFFLRLSWSPCGSYLLTTNAYSQKSGTHLAPMFVRETGLEEHVDFIGHSEPVISTRFSPRLYSEKPTGPNDAVPNKNNPGYQCFALGAKDHGASLWRAGDARPFINLQEMFDSDVNDIAWGHDGYTLVACSTDGSIMYIRFDARELGHVLPANVESKLFTELSKTFGGAAPAEKLPENLYQVKIEQQRKRNRAEPAALLPSPKKGALTAGDATKVDKGDAGLTTAANAVREEARSGTPDKSNDALTLPQSKPAEQSKETLNVVGTSTSVESTADDKNGMEVDKAPAEHFEPQNGRTAADADRTAVAAPALQPITQQREERGRGGKRRIIPQALGTPVVAAEAIDGAARAASMTVDAAFGSAPTLSAAETPTTHLAKRGQSLTAGEFVAMVSGGNSVKEMKAWITNPRGHYLLPSVTLWRGNVLYRAIDDESPPTAVEAMVQGQRLSVTMVTCSRKNSIHWRDYIGGAAVALTGVKDKYVAVATLDSFLYLYSANSGRRLLPPLAVDAPPHILECYEWDGSNILLMVTRSAVVTLYNLDRLTQLCSANAASLLVRVSSDEDDADTANANGDAAEHQSHIRRGISLASITSKGDPMLVLSDGHAFLYSRGMQTWLRVADDLAPNSEFYRTLPTQDKDNSLATLQAGAAALARTRGSALLPSADVRRSAIETVSHLEQLMASALALGSAEQYEHYLWCYVLRLSTSEAAIESGEQRLREICETLYGEGDVLGLNKRKLLRERVLPALGRSRRFQRLVEDISLTIDELESRKAS